MSEDTWDETTTQLRELLYAATADDVINVLSWDRIPLGAAVDSDADGYFAASETTPIAAVWDALRKAQWRTAWSGRPDYYVMRAPDNTMITYRAGRIYRGDRRPQEG